MATLEEFTSFLHFVKDLFPTSSAIDLSKEPVVKSWFDGFENIPKKHLFAMTREIKRQCEFFPSYKKLVEIRDQILTQTPLEQGQITCYIKGKADLSGGFKSQKYQMEDPYEILASRELSTTDYIAWYDQKMRSRTGVLLEKEVIPGGVRPPEWPERKKKFQKKQNLPDLKEVIPWMEPEQEKED